MCNTLPEFFTLVFSSTPSWDIKRKLIYQSWLGFASVRVGLGPIPTKRIGAFRNFLADERARPRRLRIVATRGRFCTRGNWMTAGIRSSQFSFTIGKGRKTRRRVIWIMRAEPATVRWPFCSLIKSKVMLNRPNIDRDDARRPIPFYPLRIYLFWHALFLSFFLSSFFLLFFFFREKGISFEAGRRWFKRGNFMSHRTARRQEFFFFFCFATAAARGIRNQEGNI